MKKTISVLVILVFLSQRIAFCTSEHNLRPPHKFSNCETLSTKQAVLKRACARRVKKAVEKIFEFYSRAANNDDIYEVLLVEKEPLREKTLDALSLQQENIPKPIKVKVTEVIDEKLSLEINKRQKLAQDYLDKARKLSKEYLAKGVQDLATYEHIVALFESARNTYEAIAVAVENSIDVLVQQSSSHIELERFRQVALDLDTRADYTISTVTSDRPFYLEAWLSSLLDEFRLFPCGIGPSGEITKIKNIIIVDDSRDPANAKQNLQIIKEFARQISIPIYYSYIAKPDAPIDYAYPLNAASILSDYFSKPNNLQVTFDDDMQIKQLVPISGGKIGLRHVFPYFDKGRSIFNDPEILEIDGNISGSGSATPFRTNITDAIDVLNLLKNFSKLTPSDWYRPNYDIRLYTENHFFNSEQSELTHKKLVPRSRIPMEFERLTVGEQFKNYCDLLNRAKGGNNIAKRRLYRPAKYTIGLNRAITIPKIISSATGGNRITRSMNSSFPFFTPQFMRRVHQAHSQILNSLPEKRKSYCVLLPLYHSRPPIPSEITVDVWTEVARKGVMSLLMMDAIEILLDQTTGDDFFSRFKNIQEHLKESYSASKDTLRETLVELETKTWSVYALDIFKIAGETLHTIDEQNYLTSAKYFWNKDQEYKDAVLQLKDYCDFLRTFYDPESEFVAHLKETFKIGTGLLMDQIIKSLIDVDLDSVNPSLKDILEKTVLIDAPATTEKDGSRYWHTQITPKGYYGDEVISALQKEIRLGNEDALFWAWELMCSGGELEKKLWERLLVISVEDVGLGDPQAVQVISELENSYWTEQANSQERHEIALNAVNFLVKSKKDRFNDEVYINYKITYTESDMPAYDERIFKKALKGGHMEKVLEQGITLILTGKEKKLFSIIESFAESRGEALRSLLNITRKNMGSFQSEDKNLFLIHAMVCVSSLNPDVLYATDKLQAIIAKTTNQPIDKTTFDKLSTSYVNIKDFHLDHHTQRGKALGRDFKFFILTGSKYLNERANRNLSYFNANIQWAKTADKDEIEAILLTDLFLWPRLNILRNNI